MSLPPSYSGPNDALVVCKLNKAMYGQKQSLRAWFGQFCLAKKKYGHEQSNVDNTLFLKMHNGK